MKKWDVTFLPFLTSDLESHAIVFASSEKEAREVFERVNPGVVFKSAVEIE